MWVRCRLPIAVVLAVGAFATSTLAARPAPARTVAASSYSAARTFYGALRYLRVELRAPVTEKDKDAGYLLFDYKPASGKKAVHGSIEVIPRGKRRSRLIVQLPGMPAYRETMIRDALLKKLAADYGPPQKEKAPKAPPRRPRQDDDDRKRDGDDKGKSRNDDENDRGRRRREPEADDDRKAPPRPHRWKGPSPFPQPRGRR